MRELMYVFAGCIVALIISARTIPTIINVSHLLNLFAEPNGRSAAKYRTPTLGGISIFIGFTIGMTLTSDGYFVQGAIYIIAATLIMFFVGLKDDVVSLSASKKLIAEIAVAAMLIYLGDFRFTSLHGFLGIDTIPFIPSVLLSGFVYIVFINAFNLVDGIDGLAAGLGIFSSSVFGAWFFLTGHTEFAIISFSLAGALAGFFFFNVYGKKNKIFMGDTGSLVLGTIMAVLVIQFNEFNIDQSAPYAIFASPAVSFGILIYPLMDTIRVFSIRIIQKKSPFVADKNHTHHRLLAIGLNHRQAMYLILAVNALFTLAILNMQWIGIMWLMIFNILAGGFLLLLPSYILSTRNMISSSDPHQQIILFSNRETDPGKGKKIALDTVPVRVTRIIREKLQNIGL
jgi:UDP-N-acetylmuramyl pentapeptide phosphotransferase/UDP-N-acetylglucosamine-1-phosphate transferase